MRLSAFNACTGSVLPGSVLPGSVMLGSVLLATSAASADFIDVTAEPFVGDGWVCNGFEGLTVWRIYANFDGQGDDGVLAVFTQPGSPWSMSSSNGAFENAPPEIDSACAPEDLTPRGIWANQWDTYLTLGRTEADGTKCGLDDNACLDGLVGDFECDAGIFVTPDDEASYAVDGRVLLGQFAVLEGEVVTGQMNLLTRDNETFKDEEIIPIDCRPDLDRSRDVGLGDLLEVLRSWGPCDPPCGACVADLDGDRNVGFQEILIMLAAWGSC